MATSAFGGSLFFNKPVSSGESAKTTSDDNPADLIGTSAMVSGRLYSRLSVFNLGATNALISIDGGTTWMYWPAGWTETMEGVIITDKNAVQMKNASAGSNLSGMWGKIW